MHQRVSAGGEDVGIKVQVPIAVEEGVRIAPLSGAVPQIVDDRIDTGRTDVRIVLKIPLVIEEAGCRDQFDVFQKYEMLVKARTKEPAPSSPPDHASDGPCESRPCRDLSKQLGDLPAGAAANGVKFFPRWCRDRFSMRSLAANGHQFHYFLVQCGLPVSAFLASGGKRGVQAGVLAAGCGERRVKFSLLTTRCRELRLKPGILATRRGKRPAKFSILVARRAEGPIKLGVLAERRSVSLVKLGLLAVRHGERHRKLGPLTTPSSERLIMPGILAARRSERRIKCGILGAHRGEVRITPGLLTVCHGAFHRQLRCLALLFFKSKAQARVFGSQP